MVIGGKMKSKKFNMDYVVDDNMSESTSYPLWFIIAYRKPALRKFEDNIHHIMDMVIGPFTSRKNAEAHRQARIYDYGERSIVYCKSCYYSDIKEIKST